MSSIPKIAQALSSGGGCTMNHALLADIIKAARTKLAPDHRTTVFDIHAQEQGNTIVLSGEVQDAGLKAAAIRFFSERSGLRITDEISMLPAPALGEKRQGVITVSVANLHRAPDHTTTVVTQALMGTPVSVLKKEGEWFFIQMPDLYLGWVTETLAWMGPEDFSGWRRLDKLMVTAQCAYVNQTADGLAGVVSDLVAGDILGLVAESGSLYQIVLPDGRSGFVDKGAARPLKEWLAGRRATPKTIVATGRRFLGVPYLWGGSSAKAFDCSGFVKMVYFLNGLLLPRDADQQAQVGRALEMDERRTGIGPGDLLFFGRAVPGDRPEITHVGLSLGGQRFLEASGYVRESSLDPADKDYRPHRAATFISAARILGAEALPGIRWLRDMP
jgi:hypothetical protein